MRFNFIFTFALLIGIQAFSQAPAEKKMLLSDEAIQLEATDAINNMYNFKFDLAEEKFLEFKQRYPEHPMPDFLMALSYWWKMMPNLDNESYTKPYVDKYFEYIDLAIEKGEKGYDADETNEEMAFFLAAAYGFKGRYYAEQHSIMKAGFAGKSALHYLFKFKGREELSPEFVFGDALFNYYSEWIKNEYVLLRPIVALFPKGNKQLGLKQLSDVARNAFYTRTEAQYFLMRIYFNEENREDLAYPTAKYLAVTFPDNAYFQRMYARIAFSQGKWAESEIVSKDILYKIAIGMPGYESTSGRYASYFLGHINTYLYRNKDAAKPYFEQTQKFAIESEGLELNYYLYATAELARTAHDSGDYAKAKSLYQSVLDNSKNDHELHKEAKKYLSRKNAKVLKEKALKAPVK